MSILDQLQFDEKDLIPAVIQDWRDGTVLMLGFMNREALRKTLETKSVHFWSRARQKLWEKGEDSGNRLSVRGVFVDCDQDTILVKVDPTGPTCHTGERACFFTAVAGNTGTKSHEAHGGLLESIYRTIENRKATRQSGSYVGSLLEGGQDRILKKVAEEAAEVILASKTGKPDEIVHEVADLFFHTLVMLGYHDLTLQDIYNELGKRFGHSGLRAKAEATPSPRPSPPGEQRGGSRGALDE